MINQEISDINQRLTELTETVNQIAASGKKPPQKEVAAFLNAFDEIGTSIHEVNSKMDAHTVKLLDIDTLSSLNVAYKTMQSKLTGIKAIMDKSGVEKLTDSKRPDAQMRVQSIFRSAQTLIKQIGQKSEELKQALTEELLSGAGSSSSSSASRPQSARELRTPTRPDDDTFERPPPKRALSDRKIVEKMIPSSKRKPSSSSSPEKSPRAKVPGLDASVDDIGNGHGDFALGEKVMSLISFLDNPTALATEGIFRISPKEDQLQKIKKQMEGNPDFSIPDGTPVHVAARLVKIAVGEMEFPDEFVSALMVGEDAHAANPELAAEAFNTQLPREQQIALLAVLDFLAKVVNNHATTKMGVPNLAVVFAPNIFKVPEGVSAMEYLAMEPQSRGAFSALLEAYINNPDAFRISGAHFER